MKDNGVIKKRTKSKRLSPAFNKPELGTWYPNRAKMITINPNDYLTSPSNNV